MGNTVVFTVPLDPDGEVEIASRGAGVSYASEFRRSFSLVVKSRVWPISVIAVAGVPVVVALGQVARGSAAYLGTALVAAVTIAVVIASAAVGTLVPLDALDGPYPRRIVAGVAISRIAGAATAAAALVVASAPAIAWAALAERLDEPRVTAMVVALALEAVAAVCAGAGVAALRSWSRPAVVGAVTGLVLIAAPLVAFAASLPFVNRADNVDRYAFVAEYADRHGITGPAFVCNTETVVETRAHTELTAWLLPASAIVAVIDAPTATGHDLAAAHDGSLVATQAALRSTRVGPDFFEGYCYQPTSLGPPKGVEESRLDRRQSTGLPASLASALVLGLAAVGLVSRRTRV